MRVRIAVFLGVLLVARTAGAWGPEGHHTVGAIADRMIAGSRAATEVHALLGALSLEDASVLADCAKGVDPDSLTYTGFGAECQVFETTAGKAEMIDFVRRNSTNCTIKRGEEVCHKQYHYADISIAHDHYDPRFEGARDDDVVKAIEAAVDVLKGKR